MGEGEGIENWENKRDLVFSHMCLVRRMKNEVSINLQLCPYYIQQKVIHFLIKKIVYRHFNLKKKKTTSQRIRNKWEYKKKKNHRIMIVEETDKTKKEEKDKKRSC